MKSCLAFLGAALLCASQPGVGRQVEEVRSGSADTPVLPEDLFRLTPATWAFARQLWKGDEPCTVEMCEAGYTTGDLVVSVERYQTSLRIVAGFRGCPSVAWNDYEIGDKASSRDTRTVGKRIKTTVGTAAEYCKQSAPTIAALDVRLLFPVSAPSAQ